MKRFSVFLAVLLVSLMLAGTAYAVTVNRTPDATIPHSPELNQASYWGESCYKVEAPLVDPDPSVATLGSPHSVVVLKSATNNFVWFDAAPGLYGTPTEQDVSHLIYCNAEVYEPCSITVAGEKELGEWYEASEPVLGEWVYDGDTRCRTTGQGLIQEWSQTFYDAENPEMICGVEEGINRRGLLGKECETAECDGMYLLQGKLYYDYPCYLTRNPETDSPYSIPERFVKDGEITSYAQGLCNQLYTCDGWTTGQFNWGGEWSFVCDWEPCLDCE